MKQIATTLDDYIYTPDDKVVEGEIEEGKRYKEPQFNRTIEIEERERYRVKLFMDQIDQREKTLVFCATQAHAALVRDLINQMKTSSDPNYCVRVTAEDGALWRAMAAHVPGQRKDHPDDPDHVAEAFDRRGCTQCPQHRADAADQLP